MRSAAVVVAAFAASALASPLKKRDEVIVTDTAYDVAYVTDVVYVTAGQEAAATTTAVETTTATPSVTLSHFGHHRSWHASSSSSTEAPAPSTTEAPASSAPAPAPTSTSEEASTSIYVAPTSYAAPSTSTVVSIFKRALSALSFSESAPALALEERSPNKKHKKPVVKVVKANKAAATKKKVTAPKKKPAPAPKKKTTVKQAPAAKKTTTTPAAKAITTPSTPAAKAITSTTPAAKAITSTAPAAIVIPSSIPAAKAINPTTSTSTSLTSTSSSASTSSQSTSQTTAYSSSVQASSSTSSAASSSAAAAAPAMATNYQEAVVNHHNYHRSNHSASDLTWDAGLASTAATIAASCVYAHNVNTNGGGYGQNIAAGVESANISAVISDLFYNGEVNFFNGLYGEANPDMTNFENWGHFSQIVWKSTTTVGCATQYCPGGLANVGSDVAPYFTVCNYGPPGKINKNFKSLKQATNIIQATTVASTATTSALLLVRRLSPGLRVSQPLAFK